MKFLFCLYLLRLRLLEFRAAAKFVMFVVGALFICGFLCGWTVAMTGLTWLFVWVDCSYDGVDLALCGWTVALNGLTWLFVWVDSSYVGVNMALWLGGF